MKMQRNISTIWWRFGGFVMGLVGTIAWTHDVAARNTSGNYLTTSPSGGYYPDGRNYATYDATGVDASDCKYYTASASGYSGWYFESQKNADLAASTNAAAPVYGGTRTLINGYPYFCYLQWWNTASATEAYNEITQILGSGWDSYNNQETSCSPTIVDSSTGVKYMRCSSYGERQLVVHNTGYPTNVVLADYGYAISSIFRIIGCENSSYTLTGATSGSDYSSLSGISCVSDEPEAVIPTSCLGIPNDDDKLTLYYRGDQGCFFWEADTATHNLYDATGKFMYTTSCSCWDDGSRMCS